MAEHPEEAMKEGVKRRRQEDRFSEYEVFVGKENFKFNAAHFVAFQGFRERLHGHNYAVGVRLRGRKNISSDGYVMDFGDVKKATRLLCKQMNERFLVPARSDVMAITEEGPQLCLKCEDGASFSMPKSDCIMLPIMHSTAEELAHYLYNKLVEHFTLEHLQARGIWQMEVSVAEMPRQEAVFKATLPDHIEDLVAMRRLLTCCTPPLQGAYAHWKRQGQEMGLARAHQEDEKGCTLCGITDRGRGREDGIRVLKPAVLSYLQERPGVEPWEDDKNPRMVVIGCASR